MGLGKNARKIISASLAGISFAFLFPVINLIHSQSASMLRNLMYLNTRALLWSIVMAAPIGSLTYLLIRESERSYLFLTAAAAFVTILAYYLIQLPPVADWFLPAPTVK